MNLMAAPVTTTNRDALESLRVILPGKEGEHRGSCASCGLHLWSEGGYRVPGLQGVFYSLLCMECAIAEKTGQTKKIPGAPIGNGARLLTYLKAEAPEVYRKLVGADNPGPAYCQNPACPHGEDGMAASLANLRAGTKYCRESCKKQAERAPRQQNWASKTPDFIEFSRDAEQGVRPDA